MKSGGVRAALLAAVLAAGAAPHARAQASGAEPDSAPRFLRAGTSASREPSPLNPLEVPNLNRRIAISLHGESRAAGIREIALASGIQFVYAADVLPNTVTLRLQHDNVTVAAALTEVLHGAGVDVVVAASGNMILVRKPGPTPGEAPPDSEPDRFMRYGTTLAPVVTVAQAESRRTFELTSTMSRMSLGAKELSAAPAPFEGDLLRTLQLLPGVETRNDYTAGLNVRGGESDQVLILLDGYPIYNPFHLFGLLGTFVEPLVGKVDLLTGAQPVRYGERLSSVLDVQSAEEGRRGVHGSVNVSLLSATASAGGAFGDGGSWMIGGRHTYADLIANAIQRNSLPYGFSDIQGHLSRTVFGGAILSVTAYSGSDGAIINQNDGGLNLGWGNHLVGATLSRTIPRAANVLGLFHIDSLALVQRVSLTTFDAAAAKATAGFGLRSAVRDLRASGSATFFTAAIDHSAGYEVSSQHLTYSMKTPSSSITNFLPAGSLDQTLTPVSGWYDALWRASPRLLVDAGVRVDAVGGMGWTGASPRISLKYFLTKDLALVAATGSYAQWLHSLVQENAPAQPLEFWIASSGSIPVSRSTQSSLGAEAWTSPSRQVRMEAFYKTYSNLIEANPDASSVSSADPYLQLSGTSYGLDVLLRQMDTGRFGGWISYSYALSERVTPAGVAFNPGQDRRHELNAVGTWKFARYRLSARIGLTTGTPYTPLLGEFTRERYNPLGNSFGPDIGGTDTQYLPGATNSARMPFGQRIDVNLTRLPHGRGVQWSPYVSVANVTFSNNPAFYTYDFAAANVVGGRQVPAPVKNSFGNLPFLPTIGVHIAY